MRAAQKVVNKLNSIHMAELGSKPYRLTMDEDFVEYIEWYDTTLCTTDNLTEAELLDEVKRSLTVVLISATDALDCM